MAINSASEKYGYRPESTADKASWFSMSAMSDMATGTLRTPSRATLLRTSSSRLPHSPRGTPLGTQHLREAIAESLAHGEGIRSLARFLVEVVRSDGT